MDQKSKAYNELYKTVKECHSGKSAKVWLVKTVALWNQAKSETAGLAELQIQVSLMIKSLKSESRCRKRATFLKFFANSGKQTSVHDKNEIAGE